MSIASLCRHTASRTATIIVAVLTINAATSAKDYCLIIGGGYDPSGNPASLERNVQFASSVLADQVPQAVVETYFADGDDPQRDVQYVDEAAARDCPPHVRIMAELFDEPRAVGFAYRDHDVKAVTGPARFDVLERQFERLGRQLKAGDRLIIYAAGHGGPALEGREELEQDRDRNSEPAVEAQNPSTEESGASEEPTLNRYDTSLLLWNQDAATTSDFAGWLDRLSPDVTVVLVMVQCYSGGFAHEIFQAADVAQGLSPARRCGFFSQLHDRAAAGCVAELDERDVEEYSTYFWAALSGKSRTGEAVDADYDNSGAVSLAEAHAYAVIESDTIDVPTRTSEALLRTYSRLGGPFEIQETDAVRPAAMPELDKGPQLLEPSGPLADLAARARPDQRAILKSLISKVATRDLLTIEDVRIELNSALEDFDDVLGLLEAAMDATDEALAVAQDDVYGRWPELYFPHSTAAARMLADDADEFVAILEKSASYAALRAARAEEDLITESRDQAERRVARLERLMRTIENVVLAANLPRVAPPGIVERYQLLLELEEQSLR